LGMRKSIVVERHEMGESCGGTGASEVSAPSDLYNVHREQ